MLNPPMPFEEGYTRVASHLAANDERPSCWCRRCEDAEREKALARGEVIFARFIVCPTCGNKRCPRATQHDLACTGSNEPGQAGSDYA